MFFYDAEVCKSQILGPQGRLGADSRMLSPTLHSDLVRTQFALHQSLLFRAAKGLSRKRLFTASPVQAAKRGKGDSGSGGGRSSGPLYITVEKDGSDIWRLDPVIKMLKEGAVSPCPVPLLDQPHDLGNS